MRKVKDVDKIPSKLYKFRRLVNAKDFCRVREIIEDGEFYCSKFTELNDPMEGVYNTTCTEKEVTEIYRAKMEYRICSFSNIDALKEVLMWGHYTGGFKGIAIEVDVSSNKENIKEVTYCKNFKEFYSSEDCVEQILTTKVDEWKYEKEYRFLKNDCAKEKEKIGEVTRVFVCDIALEFRNRDMILENSKSLSDFSVCIEMLNKLLLEKGITLSSVKYDYENNRFEICE
ncbi:DUF2971 domain-containing protein [bacterium]|nr:DUF2971 domain-containing protein [bacterium]